MIHVEIPSKVIPVCIGCEFVVITVDNRVFCTNHDCIWYLQSTTCKCGKPELPTATAEGVK